ncbi:MAG: hypothetical protein BGO59_14590 [Spirosoma sp. 48-14]|nr:MAG: hypothetical protein BGO59_14590 [Spirosoma sp. 48-14]
MWFLKTERSAYSALTFIHSAFITTIFNVVPDFFPLFTPGKRPVADDTDFIGQILFFYTFHNGNGYP